MYHKIAILLVVGVFFNVNAQTCGPAGDQNCQLRCQDNATAAALPVATVCSDSRTDCGLLFNCTGETPACEDPAAPPAPTAGDPTTIPKIRPNACDAPGTQDVALQCAKTCMICCETPEYNCEDDDTGVVDCQANIAKCTDANWTDIMSQYCPASCGLCLSGSCADINSGCNGLASLCRDIDFYDYMTTNCARTCDACESTSTTNSTSTCEDNASNCAQNSALCTNSVYYTLMQSQCACTCSGASNGGGSSCTDSNSNCVNWVRNGFCSSTFYTPAQKREYCASSCNLC